MSAACTMHWIELRVTLTVNDQFSLKIISCPTSFGDEMVHENNTMSVCSTDEAFAVQTGPATKKTAKYDKLMSII